MRIAFLLSAASLVAIASPAIAQEHATKASKSDIVVTGTLTVEAAEKDIEQTPGGVALVSAADFRARSIHHGAVHGREILLDLLSSPGYPSL